MKELIGAVGDDPRSPGSLTLPRLLRERAAEHGPRDFLRAKRHGVWAATSWGEARARVDALARAMIASGLQPGDVVAVIGENLPEAYLVQYAALSAGAAATHLYPDATAAELGYVLDHSRARLLFAEDQEQVDKFLQCSAAGVQRVVTLDNRGLWHYDDPRLVAHAQFVESAPADANTELDSRVARGQETDLAALCYTSGTSGKPKGVRLTHRHLLDNAYRLIASFGIAAHTDYFSYISPAWAAEQFTGLALGLLAPAVVHFAEKPETVAADMREIAPEFLLFTPRQWEMIASAIEAQMLDAKPLRQRLYRWAIAAPPALRPLADALVLRALRDNVGLTRARVPLSAGSGLSAEVFRRFHALGVPLRNLYGSTEAGLVSAHWGDSAEPATLGKPLKVAPASGAPLQLRIQANGELLVAGGSGFGGYHRDDEATAAVRDSEGFFHTGDAMHLHETSGELVFLDRLKDMRRLSTGAAFPPQTIENHLRASPYVRDAVVLGDEQCGYVGALINVDAGIFARYLEARNIGWGTFAELSQQPAVLEQLAREVAHVNALLPEASRIRRFAALPKELDADDAELTRSRKLKRDVIADRYGALISALYAGDATCPLDVSVVYRDGTLGKLRAEVRLCDSTPQAVAA
jgi:long-chain acyl-CoA synthetase